MRFGHGQYRTVSAVPLLTLWESRGEPDPPDYALRKALGRARRSGEVTLGMADELAVRLLGVHPSELYPGEW